ncbi:MAG: acyltransferase family protein [Woeseiaceae bacterium]
MTTPTYRPDIDGLRAIAVLAVVFYHSGFDLVSGGYVGVDVFFVISGFLITTIIVRELADGNFSIVGFYERRMRRILPASIAVVAVCLIVGSLVFETTDRANLAHSVIANSLFLSNIYFYLQTGYFDAAAELKPLLHTWSLSLEEQYYVVTPLLLMLTTRYFRQRHLVFVVPIAILSFVACVHGTGENPSATFYMLTTRAWELLIGSILAIATIPRASSEVAMRLLAVFGLSLIIYSMFMFDEQTPFPGAYAALPTIGTAILIYTGYSGGTPVNRLLSLRPAVFVGLISYSLYLWHWPMIVFAKYLKGMALSHLENVAVLLAIFAVSILSWRYVETPFRKKQLLATRKRLFFASLGATLVLIIAALLATGDVVDTEWRRWRACENVEERLAENKSLCVVGEATREPSILLWGDSHARALNSAADASAQRLGLAGYVASKPGCPPLRGIERERRPGCSEFNEALLSYVILNPNVDTVILAANWTGVLEGTRYNDETAGQNKVIDVMAGKDAPQQDATELIKTGLYRTIQTLRDNGRRIILVGPVPEVGHNVPSVNHIARITDRDVNAMIAPTIEEFKIQNTKTISFLEMVADDLGIPVVWPSDILCNDRLCIVALDDGTTLYHDDDHLSTAGARFISEILDQPLSN